MPTFFKRVLMLPLAPPLPLSAEFSLFSYNNGMVMSSCRELDNNRSALSAASAFAIATAGANEGTPTKEKYRRMSLASTGTCTPAHSSILSQCSLVLSVSLLDKKKKNARDVSIKPTCQLKYNVCPCVCFLQVSRPIRGTVTRSL